MSGRRHITFFTPISDGGWRSECDTCGTVLKIHTEREQAAFFADWHQDHPGVDPVKCRCGDYVGTHGPEWDRHFVFALRNDGTPSNLGYCPALHGLDAAIARAREMAEGAGVLYRGQRV